MPKKYKARICCICNKPFRDFEPAYYNRVNRKCWHHKCGPRDYFGPLHYKCNKPEEFECPVCYAFYKKYFEDKILSALKAVITK